MQDINPGKLRLVGNGQRQLARCVIGGSGFGFSNLKSPVNNDFLPSFSSIIKDIKDLPPIIRSDVRKGFDLSMAMSISSMMRSWLANHAAIFLILTPSST